MMHLRGDQRDFERRYTLLVILSLAATLVAHNVSIIIVHHRFVRRNVEYKAYYLSFLSCYR